MNNQNKKAYNQTGNTATKIKIRIQSYSRGHTKYMYIYIYGMNKSENHNRGINSKDKLTKENITKWRQM